MGSGYPVIHAEHQKYLQQCGGMVFVVVLGIYVWYL